MQDKHIKIRVEQCLVLAKASNCPRRKFGALLVDPERNVILMDGYNGGPRGGGELCGGDWCHRDGTGKLEVKEVFVDKGPAGFSGERWGVGLDEIQFEVFTESGGYLATYPTEAAAKAHKPIPGVKSGTEIQIGCHHAEMNVICNAAANGVRTRESWLFCTGEPCVMCAKLIHHAGIAMVLVVGGGYIGSNGIQYLQDHGVGVQLVEGPQDPRKQHESKPDGSDC